MYKFALTGISGYVAPRHIKAIYDTGNELVAALDPHDSVGMIDKYFPDCDFFTEYERFDRHLEKLKRKGDPVNYISICSPNYLHDAHCRQALRLGANAICEKPLVLNPWNLDQLTEIEKETGKKVYTILQLRLHPEVMKLKKEIDDSLHNVSIEYITPRGKWYDVSWKGDIQKSGGICTNIGIHLFDMLIWLFGNVIDYNVDVNEKKKIRGSLNLENAKVNWFLSTDQKDSKTPFRQIIIDGKEVRLDKVFNDLHTESYKNILSGNGSGIEEVKKSIELVYKLRS